MEYEQSVQNAAIIEDTAMRDAYAILRTAESEYRNARGWFWSCDPSCQRLKAEYHTALAGLNAARGKRDAALSAGRAKVGLWSKMGVADARRTFWSSVDSGNRAALQWTMMDALFLTFTSSDESTVVWLIKLAIRYLINLTVGMFTAFVHFLFAVYRLVRAYQPSFLSGALFFAMAGVAAAACLTTFILGVVGGSGACAYGAARVAIMSQIGDMPPPTHPSGTLHDESRETGRPHAD
mmetsp:Transcript_52405/g.131728  ORF Transcript_52405/g.131728 Transcript_52405/m.131728 type:complete len:237 (-) Transcript_52405:20-730(-)